MSASQKKNEEGRNKKREFINIYSVMHDFVIKYKSDLWNVSIKLK